MLTTTISSTTTEHPFRPLYRCNFTTPCFGKGQLGITNGTEFNPTSLSNTSDPPQAPTSGVTSISKYHFSPHSTFINIFMNIADEPTSNSQLCALPYRPQLDGSNDTTSWNMWFCYKNQCPTPNGQTATCVSGKHFYLIREE
jgi:hypothetical protein